MFLELYSNGLYLGLKKELMSSKQIRKSCSTKKCTKKRDTRAKLLFSANDKSKPILPMPFS